MSVTGKCSARHVHLHDFPRWFFRPIRPWCFTGAPPLNACGGARDVPLGFTAICRTFQRSRLVTVSFLTRRAELSSRVKAHRISLLSKHSSFATTRRHYSTGISVASSPLRDIQARASEQRLAVQDKLREKRRTAP